MRTLRLAALASASLFLGSAAFAQKDADVPYYNGDAGGMHYSPLAQINAGNVAQIKEAWRFDLNAEAAIENTPIVVGGVLYCVANNTIFALDAATGTQKWAYKITENTGRTRGESWWTDGKISRLLVAAGPYIYSLDPATGQPDAAFGSNGTINLNDNLRGPIAQNNVRMGSPVSVYKDVIITGGGVGEQTPASPGDIRGWNVRTGKLLWTFHTIPHPGEPNYETWPADGYLKAGGANNWAGSVMDEKRGIVYVGTGSGSDDYFGGERPGANAYADSLLAINATTGKLLWHFQAIHHDLWDDDFAAPPVLVQVKRDGKVIDAVAATNKTGWIYVFDRVTGKSLFPITEMPAPPTTVPGDTAWPTQPHPQLPAPLSWQSLTANDLTQRSPEAHAWAAQKFATFLSGPQFTPPAYNQETVVAPGFSGGDEFGGMTFDPKQQLLFVNSENIVWTTAVVDRGARAGRGGAAANAGPEPEPHSRYTFSGYHKFYDQDGYPATAAPWGTLNAIDLNTGKYVWRIPFGEYPELVAQGITNTGSESYGGGVATASGLLLIAATDFDRKFRAYDSKTGKLLMETLLPYAGNSTPLTYMVGGRQYVVIGASGARDTKGPKGAAFVAYALPK
jgi:quinoprotein glucose dehydrogenase